MVELLRSLGAWSSLLGWISIVCWIFVFTPQVYENYRRKSGEGLSLLFLYLWLIGDLLNLFGAIGQHLLPTMIVLGAYYTLADSVLVLQVYYYRRKERGERAHYRANEDRPTERSPLLTNEIGDTETRDLENLPKKREESQSFEMTWLRGLVYNVGIMLIIVVLGFMAFAVNQWLSQRMPGHHHDHGHNRHGHRHPKYPNDHVDTDQEFVWWSQILGYGSAVLYLGSRIPQMTKNAKNKSCEGLSLTMFTLSILGNVTYVLSIFLKSVSPNYILLNLSWLAGSGGTIILDAGLFYQFFIYRGNTKGSGTHGEVEVEDPARQHL